MFLYRHFGREIIARSLKTTVDDTRIDILWLKLYKVGASPHHALTFRPDDKLFLQQEFIEAIDAIDNGISQYPTDVQPRYRLRTDVSARVGFLNPAWNQSVDSQTVDVRIFASFGTDERTDLLSSVTIPQGIKACRR